MKRVVFVLMCVFLVGSMTSFAQMVVHQDNYNDRNPGDDFPAWNWADGTCSHEAVFADYNDNIVVEHTGEINNTGGIPSDCRFGSKWDITMVGNTSSDPCDYTISFDLRNVQGDWDPHPLELFVLTANPGVGGARYGHGYPTLDLAQDDWVHVEFNLADYTKNWWEGTDWDLRNSTWAIEVGGSPWPGTPVDPGESWTQIWLMDNLKITMIPESFAEFIIVYENDYEGETPGEGIPGAWDWFEGACTTHTAVFADYNDGDSNNIVVEHTSEVNSVNGTEGRYGSKWDITVSGNTSSDPNDYTISFDLRNVQGDWDPITLEVFVLTEAESDTNDAGYGSGGMSFAQSDGWVHVEYNLGGLSVGWWQGTDWVLTKSRWSIEVGMPWPGTAVPEGTSWTQMWLMDNLKITMLVHSNSFNEYPPDGATDVPRDVVLSWSPGDSADEHDVYFGTSWAEVNDANKLSGEYQTTQDVNYWATTNYAPSGLDLGGTYYWRIDDVNDACDPGLWRGDVWSFTVANYHVVEDFDSYASSSTLRDAWKDYRVNGSRAVINLMKETEDANLVQDGNSMWYEYLNSNSPYYAEGYADTADLSGEIGSDWTINGVKALVLYFYGQSDNDANEPMYVKLHDGDSDATVTYGDYGEDPNDLRLEEWQEWNIDLEDFNSAGVDLTNVTRITIGFGDGAAPGGNGDVYFDNIRLYAPRCVPGRVAGDIDNDCDVDYYDLAAIRDNWLISDYNVTPVEVSSSDPNLVGWWKLDGDLNDSSVNGNNGTHSGNPYWITGHIGSDALDFNGVNDYVSLPIGSVINSMTNSTFMTWANFSNNGGEWQRIFDFGTDVNEYMFLSPRIGADGVMRFAITTGSAGSEQIVDAPDTLASDWHHVAVTIDADNDTISLYRDGLLVGENIDANLTPSALGETTSNWLGRSQWAADAYFDGSLDDFRIYNRVLSQSEVAWLAGKTTEFTQPLYLLLTPAAPTINSYDDGAIDLKDYAATANWWLEEQVWP